MTRTTPGLAPPSPNFRTTPAGGILAITDDLTCNRPHTRRIFSGIQFRAGTLLYRSRDLATRLPQKYLSLVGSSVASERLVPALNDVGSDERCRLMDQLIAERVFMSRLDDK
ncbi:hypothetical protein AVEN_83186-1 [Araneus ventricosus]|uniref:Uncharacterized protein n=1 Tax=Araneus ventricosus TaxID=182803 RepID=A0A4Y2AMV4_ARAVE|nr:hypothetical protein AVEN_83186-1 [Araneus ventricosus]